jgi:hypothetical protein
VGATDGDVSELIEGDLRPGDQLVTKIEIPETVQTTPTNNPLLGPQRRR